MTTNEIKQRMEEINTQRFYLAMKDRWNAKDFEQDTAWLNEYYKLEKML